ncbi:MAG: tRNA (guanine-N1)-methyltransferase [Marinilabiliaceae bacterium]|nr:tRNA (guanine-N1)-methyltransferase [Marinilabiliaceae bacterium]
MRLIKPLLLIITLTLLNANVSGQETPANPLETGTVKDQFEYVINKSGKYEDYRVIKNGWVFKLRSNTLDSIKKLDNTIDNLDIKSKNQLSTIDSLQQVLNTTNEKLEEAITKKNALSFLGTNMEKSTYQNTTFTIIILLILVSIGVFFLYKKSNIITLETKNALSDLQNEFEAHRKRALEREKTMARNHLNEINKLRNQ